MSGPYTDDACPRTSCARYEVVKITTDPRDPSPAGAILRARPLDVTSAIYGTACMLISASRVEPCAVGAILLVTWEAASGRILRASVAADAPEPGGDGGAVPP